MTDPIIPWPGGKRRLAKHLLPLLASPHQCYVEPFAGAAALHFLRNELAPVEVLNDRHGELINLYRCVQHHLDEVMRQFRWALSSRQMFAWAKQQVPDTLTDIQRAARFLYLQKHAFGARPVSPTFGISAVAPPRFNLLRLEEDLSAAHLRLSHVLIEHLDWQACVARYDRPETLFFLDPPYWQTGGYGEAFGWAQYEALAATLGTLKGRAILTINDHPAVRRLFDGWPMRSLQTTYSVGPALKPARELLITTWTPASPDA